MSKSLLDNSRSGLYVSYSPQWIGKSISDRSRFFPGFRCSLLGRQILFDTPRRLGTRLRLTGLILMYTIGVLSVTACGGGGGGGDGSGSGGSLPSLVFVGNTNPAAITAGNAAKLTANITGSGDPTQIITGVSITSSSTAQNRNNGLTDLTRQLNRGFRETLLQPSRANSGQQVTIAAIPVDDTEFCDSGSVRTFGTLNDNGTGTLTAIYDCLIGNETLRGQATLRVDVFDLGNMIPTDFTVIFSRLALSGPGVDVALSGSLRSQVNIGTNTEMITENIVTLDNNTGEMSKAENLVFVDVYDNIFFPSSYTETLTGRVFDSVHGFVDITTIIPFVFSSIFQVFPDSGQMLLMGAGNASIRITALSATLVKLELDLDGDSVFENVATLKWAELSGPVGSDLADNDSDGMHNSWEVANGLNPDDPTDAALDSDGDGANNFNEYKSGSNPNNASSTPPAVSLSISISDSPDPVALGSSLTYTITVLNSSSNAANNVIVADTLPAGVNLVTATPDQGSCTGTTSLTCNLGTLNGFGNVVITIVVNPTAEGLVANTVLVTSSAFEPNSSDNSATSNTIVGQATTGIQAQIDSAAPGDTVLVSPGLYVGGINFNGKNVTLQGSDGPANTTIHGNQGTAVRIGPDGAIKGFTITGSLASFGAGIEVSGLGSLISSNIFDGNVQSGGGFGAAIGGNNASPTIEQNIFRNNSCDDQFISGIVAFVNSSSPMIVNNIFENNPCRGINLTLPDGTTPQVINNTFVGNRAGIRVDRRVSQVTQVYRNNIIVQNGIGLEVEFGIDADNPVWTNNLVFGNTTNYQGIASQTGANGNISTAPLFIDSAAGNYRLQSGSAAIDAGSALGAPGIDFDGAFRPLDGNGDGTSVVDIGAFEAPQFP